jgi:hypothetical protein
MAMKKLTAPRNAKLHVYQDVRPALTLEIEDRNKWRGCTGGEFSLDCPFCSGPEPTHLIVNPGYPL